MYAKSHPKQDGSDCDPRGIGRCAFVVAGSNAPVLLETIDEPLDTVTQAVDGLVKGASSMLVLTPWDGVTDTLAPQVTAEAAATVAFVANQAARTQPGASRAASADSALLQQLPNDALFVPVTR